MPEAAAAAAETPAAEIAEQGEGSALDRAVTAYKARQGAADAEGKAELGSTSSGKNEEKPSVTSPKPSTAVRPKPGDIASLAKREWDALQREKRANETEARYKPVTDSIAKKDLRGAIEVLVKEHGFTFADVLKAIEAEKPEDKSPEEIAAAAVAAALKVRDEDAAKERDEREKAEVGTKLAKVHADIAELANKGTAENPDRWELAALMGDTPTETWDLIQDHYIETSPRDAEGKFTGPGEKWTFEYALDLVEAHLKEKQQARRPKQDAGTTTVGSEKPRTEAASTGKGGRAAEPSFGNRTTSVAPVGRSSKSDDEDESGLSEMEQVRRAARKAKIAL